jgi:hypothetical protein
MNRALALHIGWLDELPSFSQSMAVNEQNRSEGAWTEFWSVEPSGDKDTDIARGEAYARECLRFDFYQPGWLDLTVLCICRKLSELRLPHTSPLESGFMNYIMRERPNALHGLYVRCCAEIGKPQCVTDLH